MAGTLASLLVKIGADISELKVGTDNAVKQMEKTATKFDSLGSTIQSTLFKMFTVTAVIGFAKHVVDAASDIHDMALKLGISAEAVQRFKYAAEQSGASLDDVGRAINFMNRALAGGDRSTVAALEAAGLSLYALRKLKPEEAFLAITDALKGMSNPMQQSLVQNELLGRSALALGAAVKEGFREVGTSASIMSDTTTQNVERLGDVFDAVTNQITNLAADILSEVIKWGSVLPKMNADLDRLGIAFEHVKAPKMAIPELFKPPAIRQITLTDDAIKDLSAGLDEQRKKLDDAAVAAKAHAKALESLRDALSGRGAIKAAKDMLEALRDMPPVQNLTVDAQRRINTAMAEAIAGYRAFGQVAPDSITTLHRVTLAFMFDAIPLIHNYGKALEDAGWKSIPLINSQARLAELGGTAWPKMIHDAEHYLPIVGKVVDTTEHWGVTVTAVSAAFAELASSTSGSLARVLRDVAAITASLQAASTIKTKSGGAGTGGILTPMFDEDASAAEKWAAAIAAGAAVTSGAMAVMAATSDHATKSASTLHGAMAGAKAGAAFGPYGVAVGAAAGAVVGLVRALDAGRDSVKDFAKSFGGFDALHTKLADLGTQGEQFWITLTQGVGSGNPTQAKKVIDEITAALNKQGAQTAALSGIMQEYGFTWEDLGEKARGAKLAELFDTLFEKTQILKGAGIDYSEILRRQSTDYSTLVQAAIRTGSEIPSAMKPVLQDLIEMGTLVDANGVAFTDLGDLTFAKTLTQGFDSVTQAIHELTDALTHGVGGALDDLSKRRINIPIKFDVEDLPGGDRTVPGYAGGTHGRLLNFGSGRLAMLHGREGVFTEQDIEQGLRGTGTDGGDIVINHQTILDGRVIDERITKVARKDAARGGLKPRAAHGRSY
jgi:hypothetical protein